MLLELSITSKQLNYFNSFKGYRNYASCVLLIVYYYSSYYVRILIILWITHWVLFQEFECLVVKSYVNSIV